MPGLDRNERCCGIERCDFLAGPVVVGVEHCQAGQYPVRRAEVSDTRGQHALPLLRHVEGHLPLVST